MSERHLGKEHELPSFSPEWGHPTQLMSWGKFQPEVVVVTVGNFWKQDALTGESENTFTSARRNFIGFRLVRQST